MSEDEHKIYFDKLIEILAGEHLIISNLLDSAVIDRDNPSGESVMSLLDSSLGVSWRLKKILKDLMVSEDFMDYECAILKDLLTKER